MTDELKNLPVVQEVETDVRLFLEQTGLVTISTVDDVMKAENIRKAIRGHLKAIDDKLDPLRVAAYTAYQGWLNLIKAQKGKLEELDKTLVENVKTWKKEQEEIQRIEAERIARENREREAKIKTETERLEKERLDKAAALEAAGDKKGAEAVLSVGLDARAEVERAIAPVAESQYVTPAVKLDGRTFGDRWHAEVVDLRGLCRYVLDGGPPDAIELICANMPALDRIARKVKREDIGIPGVKAAKE